MNTRVTSCIRHAQVIIQVHILGIQLVDRMLLSLAHQLDPTIELQMIRVTGLQITARGGQVMTVVITPTTTPVIIILRILSMVAPVRIHQDTAVKLFVLVIIMLSM